MNRLLSPGNRERLKAAGEVAGGFLFAFMLFNLFQYFYNPLFHPEISPGSQSFITLLIHEYPKILVAAGAVSGALHLTCGRRGDGGMYASEMVMGIGLGAAESFLDKESIDVLIGGGIALAAVFAEGKQVVDDFIHPKIACIVSGEYMGNDQV